MRDRWRKNTRRPNKLIDLAYPDAPLLLVAARKEGVQYSVADRGEELFILTNADGAIDFKIATAALNSPERKNWRDLIPYRKGIYVLDVELFSGHMVQKRTRYCRIARHRHPRP